MKDALKVVVWTGLFAVPFITLIVVNNLFFPFITGKNFTFRIVVEIIFAAWILLAFLDAAYRPRWSWIAGGFGALLVVMFFANLFGEHPATGFWSNYERMEGYVTLVHLFMYFIVAGTMLRTPLQWSWFWHASLVAAVFVALNAMGEFFDPDAGRLAGVLGNAAYLAIYMLFHVFLVFYLFMRTSNVWVRILYGFIAALLIFVLLQTGTRGTALGLATGMGVMVGYIALFARHNPQFRQYAIGLCLLMVLAGGGFLAMKDSDLVQGSSTLSRIANIDLQADLEVRGTIWSMAWQGVKERPILGWGQGNFNFVFNEQYDPFLYDQEQWFDRVHSIALDWLIAGGILGFLAYFSLYAASFYYLLRRQPLATDKQPQFSVLEQGVLVGLLVGYLTHNLVVFDNIVSYIFFAGILAMIHSRVSVPVSAIQAWRIKPATVYHIATPMVMVLLVAVIYFVNVPSLTAASDIIKGFRATDAEQQLYYFDKALNSRTFAYQEIAEQMAQRALSVQSNSEIPESTRTAFMQRAEEALVTMVDRKPGDARIHVFLGSFYRSTGNIARAQEEFAIARSLSPKKQSIIVQQGASALAAGENEQARDYFAEAFELDERNNQARLLLASALFVTGAVEEGIELVNDARSLATRPRDGFQIFSDTQAASVIRAGGGDVGEDEVSAELPVVVQNTFKQDFALDDFSINAVNSAGATEFLAELYELRVASRPERPQEWATLSYLYYELEQPAAAIAVLEDAKRAIPSFTDTAQCFIESISQDEDPRAACQ